MGETNRSRCLSHPLILLGQVSDVRCQVSDVLSVSREGSLTGAPSVLAMKARGPATAESHKRFCSSNTTKLLHDSSVAPLATHSLEYRAHKLTHGFS